MENEDLAAPAQTANQDERSLIEKFKIQKVLVDGLTTTLKEATEHLNNIEAQLISLLEDDGKSASARYEDLGYVVIIEGAAFASIEKGRQEDVLNYLRSIGRDDLIKTSVHSSSLSTFVRENLKQNLPLPSGVTFWKPKNLRFYPSKN